MHGKFLPGLALQSSALDELNQTKVTLNPPALNKMYRPLHHRRVVNIIENAVLNNVFPVCMCVVRILK